MAGNVILKKTSIDTGAFSTKAVSEDSEGSFLSIAARVGLNPMDGFDAFKMNVPNSYRLELIGMNQAERFDYGNRQAWVVGEAATYEAQPMYNQRNMQRFNAETYLPFVAGALRTAFPDARHSLDEVKSNNWIINKNWATPIHLYASIAPGYYSYANMLRESLIDKYFAFVDSETKRVYAFRLEEVSVVPESFGSYQYTLYDYAPNKAPVRKKEAEIMERVTVCVLDFGGQTLDYIKWKNRSVVPNAYKTFPIGFNDYVDLIAMDVFNDPVNAGKFAQHLTRQDILNAMRGNHGKKMFVSGIGGKKIEITGHVATQMNRFGSNAEAVWRDSLLSGQGIDILQLGGGAAIDAFPYIKDKLQHEKRMFVSKNRNPYEMWMANAVGTLTHARNVS
jgi:hypothetical protein